MHAAPSSGVGPADHGPHGPHGHDMGPADHSLDHALEFLGGFVVGYNLTHTAAYGPHTAAFTDHGVYDFHGAHIGQAQHYHGIFGKGLLRGLGGLLAPWDDGRNASIQAALLASNSVVFHRANMRVWPQGKLLKAFDDICHQVGLIRISDSPNVNGDYQLSNKIDSWDFSRPNADIWPSGYLKGIRGRTERAVVCYGLPAKIDYCPVLCRIARYLFGWRKQVNRDRYIRERATFYPLVWEFELFNMHRSLKPVDGEIKLPGRFTRDYQAVGDAYPVSPESEMRMQLLKAAIAEVFRLFWLCTSFAPEPWQVSLRQDYMTKFGLKGPWRPDGIQQWDEAEISEIRDAEIMRIIRDDLRAVRDAGLATSPGTVPPPEPGIGQFPVDLSGDGTPPIMVPPPD